MLLKEEKDQQTKLFILADKHHPWYKTYIAMRNWGCPVHYENVTAYENNINPSTDGQYWLNPEFRKMAEKTRRILSKLVNHRYIRRVRPGVYSAFGPERD